MDIAELVGWVSPAQLALGRNEAKQRLRYELVKPFSQRVIAQ